MVEEASDTVTVATGGTATVSIAVPVRPSLAAVMLVVPALTAVTDPVVDTVATAELFDDQLMARPVRTLPLASLAVPVAVVVSPIRIEERARSTERVAIGAGPVTPPPPPPQPNAAIDKAIAVRTRSGIETPLRCPGL
jgi:hypothetical protein